MTKEIPIIVKPQPSPPIESKIPGIFVKFVESLSEQESVLLGADSKVLKDKIPISDLRDTLLETEDIETVIFDGIITQRLLDISSERGIKTIIGAKQHDVTKKPLKIDVYTFSD